MIEGLQKVKVKDAAFEYKGCVMNAEEFAELSEAFDAKVKELCEGLISGEIAAHPKRAGDVTACRYCAYKGICRFDITVPGYDYEKIM